MDKTEVVLFDMNGVDIESDVNVNVKVVETEEGYAIISFESDRDPQLCISKYKDNQFFSKKTKWDLVLLLIHGDMEVHGLIKPIEELKVGVTM